MSTGLDIHFYHVKPFIPPERKNLKVLPLLIVHGWPGSVVEFQKIIPILTTPRPDKDFVFEVIAPSLPGYGFSQAAVRPGLATPQVKFTEKYLIILSIGMIFVKAIKKTKKEKKFAKCNEYLFAMNIILAMYVVNCLLFLDSCYIQKPHASSRF